MSEVSSEPRAKRARHDKSGRFAALEKLKKLKGSKHKYEVAEEVDDVYEIVDEREYAKKAQAKYGGNWIEEDGTGYAEDGRDFFEDEDDYSDDDESSNNGAKQKTKGAKKRGRDEDKPKGKGSIRNLFKNAVPKKTTNAKLDDDDILADILGELKDGTSSSSAKIIAPAKIVSATASISASTSTTRKSEDAAAKEYINNFVKNVPKKKEQPQVSLPPTTAGESIDRVLKPKQSEHPAEKCDEVKAVKVEIPTPNKPKVAMKIEKPTPIKPQVAQVQSADLHIDDDMDFSCLQDIENQFDNETPKAEQSKAPTPTPSPKPRTPKKVVEEATPESKLQQKANNSADDLQSLLSNWENICQMDSFEEEIETVAAAGTANKKLPEELKFWYWEAWESPKKLPGEVFLFGKTSEGESLTVRVQNIDHVLYLLPRKYLLDPITREPTKQKVVLTDIYNEFDQDISAELKLSNFRSRKVSKNFAYHSIGIDVPQVCEYMEIHYDGKKSTPHPKKKYKSIAHIFGTNTTPLERFLLDRKIKGPCWLTLQQCTTNKVPLSWSKAEVTVSDPRSVVPVEAPKLTPPPPLTLLTLNVRTAISPRTMKNEICMISMLVHNRFHIDKKAPEPAFNRHMCAFTRPTSRNWPFDLNAQLSKFRATKVFKHDSERALLSWFLAQYQQIDADLIVTFDMEDCQLNIIAERIFALKLPQWSRLGRLRMSDHFSKSVMEYFAGRMVCDVRHSAEECIRSRSYDLQTLCQNVLKIDENARRELNMEDIEGMYETGEGIIKLITLTMQDAAFILRMMYELNIMPLALQITNICGNIMNRTLQKGRNERNEFLLLHAFTEKNYIVPDKKVREWNNDRNASLIDIGDDGLGQDSTVNASSTGRKKAAYAGGLVLDPIKGLYDTYVLLMDFNSLYPSIIQEYNICFTTVQQPYNPEDLPTLPKPGIEPGILPQQLRRLVESRREVKKLMATPDLSPEQYLQYHIRQMALKLTANSMYGCLGFGQSRFYAQHLAALVTFKGREILTNTKSLVEKMNYNVVYGDTDSIMINTNITDYDQVFKIGHGIKQTVNKTYKQLEIDIDGVFSCLLLLKKKKYAAVKVSKNNKGELKKEQEHKGLDIVRRDWSQVAVMVGKYVLDEILAEKPLDEKLDAIHTKLEEIKENVLNGVVPMSMFIITKQLSKAPAEFNNANSMPHVQVALRMNKTRNRRYKKGDMVDYIICEDGTSNPATQRAYHLDELKTSETLKLDNNYYLSHQIHPVVTRMVEVLDGTDAGRIAECLGLDPSKYKHAIQRSYEERSDDFVGESIVKTALQKYRLCDKFKFVCVTCNAENMVASGFRPKSLTGAKTAESYQQSHEAVLEKCVNPDCNTLPYQHIIAIRNQLILTMRSHIKRFYQNWLVCDDPACNQNTRYYTHVTSGNLPVCHQCKNGSLVRQYTENDLYNQLKYFQYMFDLSNNQHKNLKLIPDLENAYHVLRETVDQQLQKSAYSTINGAKLFLRLQPDIAEASVKKPLPVMVPFSLDD